MDPISDFYSSEPARGAIRTAYARRELPKTKRTELFSNVLQNAGPLASNIAAFDHLVSQILEAQVAHKSPCDENGYYSFKNLRWHKPTMADGSPKFPYMARQRGLTYSGDLVGDVSRTNYETGVSKVVQPGVVVFSIPVMLGSVICHLRGYTPDELRAVYEDENDPLGYFITRGSERVVMNQDGLAFSQQVTYVAGTMVTRITNHRVSGTTVVASKVGAKWPTVDVVVYHSGMKGTPSRPEYCAFALFDVLFQFSNPKKYAYERGALDTIADGRDVADDVVEKRRLIISDAIGLIDRFVPPEHRDRIAYFLSASQAVYAAIDRPVLNLVVNRSHGTQISTMARTVVASMARRLTANAIAAKTEVVNAEYSYEQNPDIPVLKENLEHAQRIADVAERVAMAAVKQAKDAQTGSLSSYEACAKVVVREFFTDVFPGVPFALKPEHLARLVAQQCLVSSGVRPKDDLDSWGNRRIKLPADWVSQLFNANFKLNLSQGGCLTMNASAMSEAVLSSFSMGGNVRENVVHVPKRDTQISLDAQITRVNTPVQRKSKIQSIRLVHSTHTGYVCPAETPGGDACGVTKNMCCTTSISLRRDDRAYGVAILRPLMATEAGEYSEEEGRTVSIVVDGAIVGWTHPGFARKLRRATKRHPDFYDISIAYLRADSTIDINTTGTRIMHPLFTVTGDGMPGESDGRLVIDTLPEGAYEWPLMRLVTAGAIEFVSSIEQQFYMVAEYAHEVPSLFEKRMKSHAENPDREFLEMYSMIDGMALLSIATALMPMPQTCQAPRVSYQAGMATQSLGLYNDSYYTRFDTAFKRIPSTRPTLETRMAREVGLNKSPTGRMLTVAYLSFANNGEDGIVVNKRALEDIRLVKYSSHKITVRLASPEDASVPNTSYEKLERPEEASVKAAGTQRYSLYRAIDESGLPRIGAYISKGGCIIGRTRRIVDADGVATTKNVSIFAGVGEEGVVDRVSVVSADTDREDGSVGVVYVRVRIRQNRGINEGDKLASRYSQKGTVAKIRTNVGGALASRKVDGDARLEALGRHMNPAMERATLAEVILGEGTAPTDANDADDEVAGIRFARTIPRVASGPNAGMVPDVVINPASMPSRMTIGMLYEMFLSKSSLYTGDRFDGTIFEQISDEELKRVNDVLERNCGGTELAAWGYEAMEHPDGKKSSRGEAYAFVAPCYYQFLKHSVLDKIQYRSEGCRVQLTHQPVGGRAKEGGLRQGEMEKTALCSWGAADTVRERLMLVSDKYPYEVCATCGNQAATKHSLNVRECRICPKDKAKIVVVDTPYVHLLISRMVSGLGINAALSDLTPPYRPPDV